MDRFLDRLDTWATGRVLLGLLIGMFAIGATLFLWVGGRIAAGSGGERPLDVRLTYSADEAYAVIGAMDAATRRFYAATEATLDVAYPIAGALFFSGLILYLLRKKDPRHRLRRLALIPFGTMIADLLENAGIVTMLLRYPERLEILAAITGAFTSLKWAFAAATVVAAGIAIVLAARARSRGPWT